VNLRLKLPEPALPYFDHFNMGVNGVRITDRRLHRIAGVRFKPEGIFLRTRRKDSCKPIEFALTVREIKEIIAIKEKKAGKAQTFKIRLSYFSGLLSCRIISMLPTRQVRL
jgi:hypothetical protein